MIHKRHIFISLVIGLFMTVSICFILELPQQAFSSQNVLSENMLLKKIRDQVIQNDLNNGKADNNSTIPVLK